MSEKERQCEPGLPRLLTAEEVCEMFGSFGRHRLYQLARSGQIPAVRMGRAYRFTVSALQGWIDAGGSPANKKEDT